MHWSIRAGWRVRSFTGRASACWFSLQWEPCVTSPQLGNGNGVHSFCSLTAASKWYNFVGENYKKKIFIWKNILFKVFKLLPVVTVDTRTLRHCYYLMSKGFGGKRHMYIHSMHRIYFTMDPYLVLRRQQFDFRKRTGCYVIFTPLVSSYFFPCMQCCSWKNNSGGTVEITNRYMKVDSMWKYILESIFTGMVKGNFNLIRYSVPVRTGPNRALPVCHIG